MGCAAQSIVVHCPVDRNELLPNHCGPVSICLPVSIHPGPPPPKLRCVIHPSIKGPIQLFRGTAVVLLVMVWEELRRSHQKPVMGRIRISNNGTGHSHASDRRCTLRVLCSIQSVTESGPWSFNFEYSNPMQVRLFVGQVKFQLDLIVDLPGEW